MDLLTLLLIILAAAVVATLILVEIFFLPGIGLIGIFGGLIFAGLGFYFIQSGNPAYAIVFALGTVALFVIGFYVMGQKKVLSKISLEKNIDGVAHQLPEGVAIGDQGKALSRLALGGMVEVNGVQFEATSESGLIDEHSTIRITRMEKDKIFVTLVE